jgi:hypothetical protein
MDSKILDVKKTMLQGDVTTEKIWRALFPIKMRQGPKARCVLYPFLLESLQFVEGLYFVLTLEREAQRNRENNLCIEYSE